MTCYRKCIYLLAILGYLYIFVEKAQMEVYTIR
jgi:hypothetical protein